MGCLCGMLVHTRPCGCLATCSRAACVSADAQMVLWRLTGAPGVALQVLRLELDAGGLPGYLFAPRQCVIRKYMRKEEDGVYTIMFE